MTFLRSTLFNICFILWGLVSAFLFAPFFFLSPRASVTAGRPWAKLTLWFARVFLGIRHEIRGAEHMVDGPVIYASKHQSAWDTTIFLILFAWPAYVLKRELLRLPFWGWYLWRMQMIAIDRSAGASGMKSMIKQGKAALAQNRPIVIFPEGTRTRVGSEPHYHPGVAALYSMLNVPVIPIALNSGVFWAKNAYIKHPGTVIMQFLPPIAPGMKKDAFMARLENDIETASQKLIEEAQSQRK